MNIYSIPDIIAFILNANFALRLLPLKKNKKVKNWLLVTILFFVLWNGVNLIALNLQSNGWPLFSAQITYRILFLFPALILLITLKIQEKGTNNFEVFRDILILILPVILLAIKFPSFNLKLVEFSRPIKITSFTIFANHDPLFLAILLLTTIYIGISIYFFKKNEKNILSINNKHLYKLLIYGLTGLYILFLFIHFVNNFVNSFPRYYFIKTIFLIIQVTYFLFIISLLEKKEHQLSKSNFTSYAVFTFIIAIFIFSIQLILNIIHSFTNASTFYYDAIIIIVLSLLFQPVEVFVSRAVTGKIKNSENNYRANFLKLTNELIELLPIEHLAERIREFIISNFKCTDVYFFRYDLKTENFEAPNLNFEIEADSEFIKSIENGQEIIDFYELPISSNDEVWKFFNEKDVQLIVPIQKSKELIMFFALAKKVNHKDYSSEELEILSIFRNEISLYLQRNYYFEEIKQHEKEKFRLEKLAALGQLTAGIAHEIRNPLNTISSAAQTLEKAEINPEIQKRMAKYIIDEAKRLSGLVNEFLELSRIKRPELEEVFLDEILEKLKIFLTTKNQSIQYKIENSVKKPVISDKKFLYQILTNITSNSIEAIENQCKEVKKDCKDTKIHIKIKKLNDNIIITISNNGPPISKDVQTRIFEPFFTTKENGTGLGLLLVENMVSSLKGEISLKSNKARTQFLIKIPQK